MATYKIYHNTLAEALDEVEKMAKDKGYTIDQNDLFQFGVGGINYGQTKRDNFDLLQGGVPSKPKRYATVAIYRMDSGRYELTAYIG